MIRLSEQAKSRKDILSKLLELGELFTEYFDKAYKDFKKDDKKQLNHHIKELQAWQDKIKKFRYKNNNSVRDDDLIDWFFFLGGLPKDIF